MNARGRRRVDYRPLTTAERVALVLRAEARGDHDDRRRLMHDAPMKTYQITDPAVMGRLRDAQRAVAWLLAIEGPALADAAAVGMVADTLPNWVACAGDAAAHHVFRALSDCAQRSEAEIDGLLYESHEAVREPFDTCSSHCGNASVAACAPPWRRAQLWTRLPAASSVWTARRLSSHWRPRSCGQRSQQRSSPTKKRLPRWSTRCWAVWMPTPNAARREPVSPSARRQADAAV